MIDTSTATGYLGAQVGQIERLANAAKLHITVAAAAGLLSFYSFDTSTEWAARHLPATRRWKRRWH